ncbi:MAG: signal peptidase I [Candidatus Nanopelagicales bacterium]
MAIPAQAPMPGDEATATPADGPRRSSTGLFLAALVARTWLWFVAGCLLVTLLPMVIGWRPFVVESGSMQPRIDVGDIVLAAPETDPQNLLGRVTVFDDPERPESTKTHRVIAINDDGTMTTKGDANPNADTAPLKIEDVRGLGRLLVTFAGLPMVWMHTGQYFYLGLFLLSLVIASYLVGRDRDEEIPEDDEAGSDGPDGGIVPLPTRLTDGGASLDKAASQPLDPGLRREGAFGPLRRRSAWILVLVAALFAPTGTAAAFSATTRNAASSFEVPNWDYTSTIQDYGPYLYWKLDETGTTATAADASGNGRTGSYRTNGGTTYFTKGVTGGLVTDSPNRAVTQRNTNSCINTTSNTAIAAPQSVTVIGWFNGTGTANGKIVGFEMPRTGVAVAGNGGTYDRHIYVDGDGQVWFGVYNNGFYTIGSGTGTDYTDGEWHMAAASLGPSGMRLYVDGVLVGTNANNQGEATTGWWRAGCGNLAGWGASWGGTNNPTTNSGTTQNRPFLGSLDEISVHNSVLTDAEIYQAYIAR